MDLTGTKETIINLNILKKEFQNKDRLYMKDMFMKVPCGLSSFQKVKGHFNPGLFNHELFNPMVQMFMVEKSGVEKFMVDKYGVQLSGVEAWG